MAEVRLKRCGGETRVVKTRRGMSLQDITLALNPETGQWSAPVLCRLNQVPVLRQDWPVTRPGRKDVVEFCWLPLGGGGGSNPLKTILSLAVTIAAGWAGAAVAAALGWGALGQGLLTGALMVGGSYLIGTIFPTSGVPSGHLQSMANEQADPTYSLNGANNMARLGQPVPEGFGRIKIIPDRVMGYYYLYIGNEQYVHQVFMLGYGEYDVETMMFGDSVFWTKNGGVDTAYEVEVQFCRPGEAVTLFPDNVEVSAEVSGQRLFAPNESEYAGWLGPYSANPPGTSTTRIVCNLVLPQGLGRYGIEGLLWYQWIDYVFEYQRIDDNGNPLSGWATLASRQISMSTLTAQRLSVDVAVGAGRYQVRARRTNNVELDGRSIHMMQWESLQAFLPGSLVYNQSVVAMRAKATNTLSQQAASTVGVVYTRKLPLWDNGTQSWSAPRPTRSFAAAVSQVLRADYAGNLSDSRIDLDALWTIDQTLAARGWTFDGYFSGPYVVWRAVIEMCQPFGVIPRVSAGNLSFVLDQAGRPPRHIFTPENIVRGSLSVTYSARTEDAPDDVSVSYLDESAGFQQRDVTAALPGSESRNVSSRSFIGVVKREQAFRMATKLAAGNNHRRLEFRWQTEGVGRLLMPGDVAVIHHPIFGFRQSGELKSWNEDEISFDLGREIKLEDESEPLFLALNGRDGRPWGPCRVDSIEGQAARLNPADFALILNQTGNNPFDWASNGQRAFATVWTLEAAETLDDRVIITAVKPSGRFRFEITAMNDHPDAYGYQDLPTPPWEYRENTPGQADLAAPANFTARPLGTAEAPTVALSWPPVPGADGYLIQYASAGGGWASSPNVSINAVELAVPPGEISIRAAAYNREKTGPWGRWNGDTDLMFLPPPELMQVGAYTAGNLSLAWTPADSAPAYDYRLEIRPEGAASAARTADLLPTVTGYVYTAAMGMADGGPWRAVTAELEARSHLASSQKTSLTAYDAPPEEPVSLDAAVAATSVTLTRADVSGENTGYVVARGDSENFGIEDVLEIRTAAALPFAWTGLTPNTTYYFRVAAKDALFDLIADHLALNYSPSLTITTADA